MCVCESVCLGGGSEDQGYVKRFVASSMLVCDLALRAGNTFGLTGPDCQLSGFLSALANCCRANVSNWANQVKLPIPF